MNPRVQDFLDAETDYRTISAPTVYDARTGLPIPGTTTRITQDDQNRTAQPLGAPVGLEQDAVMPLVGTIHYGVVIPALSISSNGTTIIAVTCSAPHGLVTNNQISVQGLANKSACGFYSITVTTATAFTWSVSRPISAASLLTPSTKLITVLVGLPLGYDQIPQTES